MKVAYISPVRDGTGYSEAAANYMLALDSVGVDVVSRPISMTPRKVGLDDKLESFEKKDLQNVDAVIQHNLPSEFAYTGAAKNIGMFAYETDSLPQADWKEKLQLLDKVIVFCKHQKEKQVPDLNAEVVPHATDVTKYTKEYQKINFGLPDNCLKFYAISEWNRRKDFPSMLLAYYSSFTADDNVCLIVKSSTPRNQFKEICHNMKKQCSRFASEDAYPKVIYINEFLPEEQICALHQSCDIYLSTSRGEAWSYPCMDALGFGNHVIVPKHTAFKDYVSIPYIGNFVSSSKVRVISDDQGDLYSSEESWYRSDIDDLIRSLRSIYNRKRFRDEILSDRRKQERKDLVQNNFSYSAIGERLLNAIKP